MFSKMGTKMKKRKLHEGFTLVEMLVSLALFSVVITIGIGSLLTMVDANAKAQALYSSTTNLSFALDSMTRELRTGRHYYCDTRSASDSSVPSDHDDTRDCSAGNFITFTRERDGAQYGYRLKDGALEQYEGGRWIEMTSTRDVTIDNFSLNVNGSDTYQNGSDDIQPSVEVSIRGRVNNGLDNDTVFNIQTHIVQRRIDIY